MSYSELFGENKGWISYGYHKNEGSQYDWCKTNVTAPTSSNKAIENMDKTRAGSSPVDHTKGYAGWWNRSLKVGNTSYFGSMNTYGAPNDGYNANLYFGVVPAFSM